MSLQTFNVNSRIRSRPCYQRVRHPSRNCLRYSFHHRRPSLRLPLLLPLSMRTWKRILTAISRVVDVKYFERLLPLTLASYVFGSLIIKAAASPFRGSVGLG